MKAKTAQRARACLECFGNSWGWLLAVLSMLVSRFSLKRVSNALKMRQCSPNPGNSPGRSRKFLAADAKWKG